MNIGEYIQKFGAGLNKMLASKSVQDDDLGDLPRPAKKADAEDFSESSNSLIRSLTGSISEVGDFYFPADLIGGTCPRIPGEEEEIVWNAAAEACDSERVHVVWQSVGNRIWYLAVRSSDLSSNANSWCPLAALLPTQKDMASLPICYTYFGEEMAVLMVVASDELHIFRGTAAVVRAKAERTAREFGEKTTVINIDPFRIGQLVPVPWYSASLFEDRARRILATCSVLASLLITGVSFLVWLSASMSMISSRHDLTDALERTQSKSMQMVREAEEMRSSPMRDQIEKFLNVNDGLLSLNGFLTVYDIKEKVVRWRAIVPPSATADRISAMGGKNIETNDQGVVIGNQAQIDFEATKERR